MKKVYQVIRLLKLQILSGISNGTSVRTPGFPIFLALIMLLAMPFLLAQEYVNVIPPHSLFQSTEDSFRVGVPEGWVIHDVNNTGSMLIQESKQGYGILAQLCPAQEGEGQQQQQQGAVASVITTSSGSCQQQQQQAQEEIIHIIRYPNLGPRLGIAVGPIDDIIPDSVLNYQIQKLQEVGYRDVEIVNSTDEIIRFTNPQTNQTIATVPARFVEITYTTDSAPSEMRTGYLLSTASNAVPSDLETITGYSVFYEGASSGTEAVAEEETTGSARLSPASTAVQVIFGTFRLIPSEEATRYIYHARAQQATVSNQADDAAEESNQITSATIEYPKITSVVIIVIYSLLVIGVVWKFVRYMRENHKSRVNEIS